MASDTLIQIIFLNKSLRIMSISMETSHLIITIAKDVHEHLIHKLKWLKQNDAVAVKIMRNSRDFVRNILMPSHIYCYHLKLIEVSFQFDKKVELLFDK